MEIVSRARSLLSHFVTQSADGQFGCPVCGHERYRDARRYVPKGSASCFIGRQLVVCAGCGTRRIYPMPPDEELSKYYENYSSPEAADWQSGLFDLQARARVAYFRDVLSDRRPLNVLDIGAGDGSIATHLAKLGAIQYDAIELDADSIRRLNANRLVRRVLRSLEETGDQYDLVVLSHFLEHLTTPVAYLSRLRLNLRHDAALFIEVPNEDFRFKTSNEPHLVFFSPNTLRLALQRAGYVVRQTDTFGVATRELVDLFAQGKRLKLKQIAADREGNLSARGLLMEALMKTRRATQQRMVDAADVPNPDGQWIRALAAPA